MLSTPTYPLASRELKFRERAGPSEGQVSQHTEAELVYQIPQRQHMATVMVGQERSAVPMHIC